MAKSERNLALPEARTVEQVKDSAGAIEFGTLPADVISEIEKFTRREPGGGPRAR